MAWTAYYFYILKPEWPQKIAEKYKGLYELVYNKYFVDEFYFSKLINPIVEVSKGMWLYIDVNFIDKTTYVLSDFVKSNSLGFRGLQNGNMQQYAMYVALGVVASVTYVLMG